MTRRQQFHELGVSHVRRHLAAAGIRAKDLDGWGGIDLLTETCATVAVRVSQLTRIARTIRGTRYQYAAASWGLHQHGRRRTRADVWVLLLRVAGDQWRAWVVPGALLAGRLTVQLILGEATAPQGRPRAAAVRGYEERWDVVGERAA